MRLRNVTGYPLEIALYHVVVGPGDVVDTDELVAADGTVHDMDVHGTITGLVPDDEPAPAKTPAKKTATAAQTQAEVAR